MKIVKDELYKATFAHCLDSEDIIEQVVIGKKYFRLRSQLLDLGYENTSLEIVE